MNKELKYDFYKLPDELLEYTKWYTLKKYL